MLQQCAVGTSGKLDPERSTIECTGHRLCRPRSRVGGAVQNHHRQRFTQTFACPVRCPLHRSPLPKAPIHPSVREPVTQSLHSAHAQARKVLCIRLCFFWSWHEHLLHFEDLSQTSLWSIQRSQKTQLLTCLRCRLAGSGSGCKHAHVPKQNQDGDKQEAHWSGNGFGWIRGGWQNQ